MAVRKEVVFQIHSDQFKYLILSSIPAVHTCKVKWYLGICIYTIIVLEVALLSCLTKH